MKNKHVQLLTEAKKHLWNGSGGYDFFYSTRFICIALKRASLVLDGNYTKSLKALEKLIGKRIEDHDNFELWLKSKGAQNITQEKLQAHRLAWIDMLIKEFS